ncbi:MAG: hypothetical protein ACI92O_000320 [Colwellia sp.]|jgi:hypothetical protein
MSLDRTNATDLIVCSKILDEVLVKVNQFNATKISIIQDKINKIIQDEGHDLVELFDDCEP